MLEKIAFTVKYLVLCGLLCNSLLAVRGYAGQPSVILSKGQTVYAPIYSHIYSGDKENPVYLSATLSIRNTDPQHAITVTKADYYNSKGQKIKSYLEKPVVLDAMSATRFVIKESDRKGGSGANFIVEWNAKTLVNPPLIESIMISTRSALGISFTSRGQVIR